MSWGMLPTTLTTNIKKGGNLFEVFTQARQKRELYVVLYGLRRNLAARLFPEEKRGK